MHDYVSDVYEQTSAYDMFLYEQCSSSWTMTLRATVMKSQQSSMKHLVKKKAV